MTRALVFQQGCCFGHTARLCCQCGGDGSQVHRAPGPRQWSSAPPHLCQPRRNPTGLRVRSCAILQDRRMGQDAGSQWKHRESLLQGMTKHNKGLLVCRGLETQEEQIPGQPLPLELGQARGLHLSAEAQPWLTEWQGSHRSRAHGTCREGCSGAVWLGPQWTIAHQNQDRRAFLCCLVMSLQHLLLHIRPCGKGSIFEESTCFYQVDDGGKFEAEAVT